MGNGKGWYKLLANCIDTHSVDYKLGNDVQNMQKRMSYGLADRCSLLYIIHHKADNLVDCTASEVLPIPSSLHEPTLTNHPQQDLYKAISVANPSYLNHTVFIQCTNKAFTHHSTPKDCKELLNQCIRAGLGMDGETLPQLGKWVVGPRDEIVKRAVGPKDGAMYGHFGEAEGRRYVISEVRGR